MGVVHNLPDHGVDLYERIQNKFSLHFSKVCTNFYKYLKFSRISVI
jgi:hypothetical protein